MARCQIRLTGSILSASKISRDRTMKITATVATSNGMPGRSHRGCGLSRHSSPAQTSEAIQEAERQYKAVVRYSPGRGATIGWDKVILCQLRDPQRCVGRLPAVDEGATKSAICCLTGQSSIDTI